MQTDRAFVRSRDGFTLIEVLIAMLILSVGLLGLEALGIGASRMIVRAEKESRASTLAATYLENGLAEAKADPTPTSSCTVPAGSDTICVAIDSIAGVSNTRRVTVTVKPGAGAVKIEEFEVSSTVYDPAIP
ncbi:MAG TPA: prepilin-type N-terminal cleavage/methylation domain-containing protein [Longimicrobiaceae bacterium]|nr:prepilin-type N-terminal cleavage/methylation domain-containing protein [Longimicrobiaceae bacterium]